MLEQFNMKMLGGAFVIVVLLCAGIYFYAEWSNKRFASELGVPSQLTATSKPAAETESDEVSPVEERTLNEPQKFVNDEVSEDAVVSEPELVETSEPINEDVPVKESGIAESAAEFDPTPLLSAFGLPEEVSTLLDEGTGEEDFQKAETYLIEEYGQSPEVTAILDRLKQMSGGPVELDALTGLFEAWIQVLPEEDRETRRQLMGALTQLYQVQTSGGGGEIRIEVRVNENVVVE